jgi:hypothetical protein
LIASCVWRVRWVASTIWRSRLAVRIRLLAVKWTGGNVTLAAVDSDPRVFNCDVIIDLIMSNCVVDDDNGRFVDEKFVFLDLFGLVVLPVTGFGWFG